MMSSKALKTFVILLLCLAASACVSTSYPTKNASLVTDQTFGRYHENLEPDLILITMTPTQHALLTEMKPVPVGGKLPPRYAEFLERMNSKYGLNRVANWPLPAIEIFCVVFEIQGSTSRESVIAALEKEAGVETAQLVQTFDTQAQNYNDPYLSLQHGVHSIQAISSHQWSRGQGVRIAVVDTGMDSTHPELSSSTEAIKNFVDNDEDIFRTDTHGTAVGGVIAANADNETGIVGIAPDATLLPLKACWHTIEDASKAICNSLTLAKAINYSIEQEVDIINLSLTGPPDPVLERLVLEAVSRNIVVIGAKPAHNNKAFPVSINGTIAVTMPADESKTLSAPGRRVLSIMPNEQYEFFDGSSFSTAHITGLAALIRSLSPTLAPADLLALLEITADTTTGAVNACRAVDLVKRLIDQSQNIDNCL